MQHQCRRRGELSFLRGGYYAKVEAVKIPLNMTASNILHMHFWVPQLGIILV